MRLEDLKEREQPFLVDDVPWMQVLPRYDGPWLGGVAQSIGRLLGAPPTAPELPDGYLPRALTDGVRRVALVIADAFGYVELTEALAQGRFPGVVRRLDAGEALLRPVTSCFPSTTCVALTALATGQAPAVTGQIGFTVFLEGGVGNLLRWQWASDGRPLEMEPETWLPVPSVSQRLVDAGAAANVLLPAAIASSALVRMRSRGARVVPTGSPQGVFAVLAEMLEATRGEKAYIEAYWSNVDASAHVYGPGSAAHRLEIAVLDLSLAETVLALPPQGDALVIITADHGQVRNDPALRVDLTERPRVLEALAGPPAGERRVLYLKAGQGGVASAMAVLEAELGDKAWFVTAEEAWRRGVFGPPALPRSPRVGDIIGFARPGVQLHYPFQEQERGHSHAGSHGGLTRREMLVPFLALRV